MKKAAGKFLKGTSVRVTSSLPIHSDFEEVLRLIEASRIRAIAAVNTTLVDLYWKIGEYISRKIESAAWGEGVVDQLSTHIARTHPGLRGFARPNLFRMRQFFESYREQESVSPMVRQLPSTHNLLILSRSKRPEEHEFYQLAESQSETDPRDEASPAPKLPALKKSRKSRKQ